MFRYLAPTMQGVQFLLLTFTALLPFRSSSLSLKRRNKPLTSSALASQPNCHDWESSEKYILTMKIMNQPFRKWQFLAWLERKKSPLYIKKRITFITRYRAFNARRESGCDCPVPFSLLVLKFPDIMLVLRPIKPPFVDETALKAESD